MRAKTLFIIIFTVLITVFLMINTDAVEFNFIFGTGQISKLVVIGVCSVIGFIVGYAVGKPRTVVTTYDRIPEREDDNGAIVPPAKKDELSEEDRDYIS